LKKKFILEGLCCANSATQIENAINKVDGVKEATVNLLTTKLVIDGEDEKMPAIIQAAEKIIKNIEPDVIMKKA